METKRPRDRSRVPAFTPVPRARHRTTGWTPERQVEFIHALGECGCVEDACARVGMSTSAAYALRRHVHAASFRQAWDIALDYAIRRLGDSAFSRALHGVSRPVYYKGEQIGERRYYDERLTMFLLRYRDPERYGAWLDKHVAQRTDPDGAAIILAHAARGVRDDARAEAAGKRKAPRKPFATRRRTSEGQFQQEAERRDAVPRSGASMGDVA